MEAYKKMIWGSVVLAVLLIVPLVVYFFFLNRPTPPVPTPLPQTDSKQPLQKVEKITEKETANKNQLPPLDVQLNDSDDTVRDLLKNCSSHPGFSRWLINDDLVRRAVVITDNIANGVSPAPHLEFLQPQKNFEALKKPGDSVTGKEDKTSGAGDNLEEYDVYIYMSPQSYKRYDSIANIIDSLDADQLIEIYQRIKATGLPAQAYKELGYQQEKFDDTLLRALGECLAVPLLEGEIQLERRITSYAFADPELEALTPAQKHLLRMGPKNIKKIQDKLREIKDRLK